MNLQELKQKNPAELISEAEKLGIENPSTLRKQEILFAILKKLAEKNEKISGFLKSVYGQEIFKETLANFKVPKKVEFCELPKTSTGKIQKFELRKKAKEIN